MAAFTYSTQVSTVQYSVVQYSTVQYSTQGTQEKKTAAKLEKLSKENPEVAESLLKTVNVPTTGPPNRSVISRLSVAPASARQITTDQYSVLGSGTF